MVPTYPLIFPTSPVPLPMLWEFPKYANCIWYHGHLHDPYFFQFSNNVSILISPLFFLFLLWGLPGEQSALFGRFFIFVDYHWFRSSGRDYVILLYLKIPDRLTSLILPDGFQIGHVPIVRLVELKKNNSQLPFDYLHPPVLSCLDLYNFVVTSLFLH